MQGAVAYQREREPVMENMKADLLMARNVPKQQILHDSRVYYRSVTDIQKTVTGLAGKVQIDGQHHLARHWWGNRWVTGRLWDAVPHGL